MEQHRPNFDDEIGFFLNACPGPPVARRGLHIAAFQEVRSIPRLERPREDDEPGEVPGRRRGFVQGGRDRPYLSTVAGVAEFVGCRRDYLSEAALRHGYEYSKALRWIRFLHGLALRARGVDALTFALRLGFSDVAGWSRFTKRLVGKTASQLPNLPLKHWVRRAVDDVFLAAATKTGSPETNHPEDNKNH